MAVWIVFFATMTAAGRTDGRHTGDSLPFWQQACEANRPNACRRLLQVERSYCDDNSGWACNELGAHYAEGTIVTADASIARRLLRARVRAAVPGGVRQPARRPARSVDAPPRVFDLRLLLREGGLNLLDMPEPDLYARACEHGWTFACGRTQASN